MLIVEKSFLFALDIIKFTEELEAKKKFNLANQLFRSGTSIGANIREAQNAESHEKSHVASYISNETVCVINDVFLSFFI